MSNTKKNFFSGLFYSAFAKYSNVIINIVIAGILARLLTPEEFGIVAISVVFMVFFNLLGYFIQPAIIQNKLVDEEDLQSIFVFTYILGIIFSGLFILISPLIVDFYGRDELLLICQLLSATIFLNMINNVPKAIAYKNLKFKKAGIIDVSANITGGLTAVILAYLGYGFYALVYKSIIIAGMSFMLFFRDSNLHLMSKFKFSSLEKIREFSVNQFFVTLTNYFTRNSDNLLIGKFLGPSALGYYDKAYRLMMMPVSNLSSVISPVLHPVLSKHEKEPNIIYNFYVKITKVLSLLSFPLSALLFFSAYEIINIIYGPNWNESVAVFKYLSLTISFQVILSTSGSIFKALNRPDLMLKAGLITAFLFIFGVMVALIFGEDINSVGLAILIIFVLTFLVTYYYLIIYGLKESLLSFFRIFIFPLFLFSINFICLGLFEFLVDMSSIWLSLSLKIILSASISSLFIFSTKNNRNLLIQLFKNRREIKKS